MKKTFLLTLTAACAFAAAAHTPDSAATVMRLPLDKCVEIALSSNPTIKVNDMEIKRSDYSKKENMAQLFPQISFAGNYQRTIELQTINMNMGGQTQSFKMGSDNQWNFGFSASMPLIAPTLWKSISISDTQIMQSVETARASRLDMVNQVNCAYYALMLAEASYNVIHDNYDVARLNADTYKKRFEQGTATEYDVLRSSVQVKNIEPELLQADISIKQCALQLKVLMGISDNVDIRPTQTLEDLREKMNSYTSALDPSLADNTSLRTLDLQAKMLRQNVALQKLQFLPTLSASFNLNWNALSNGNALKNQQFNPYSNVGLTLSLPIFTGGSRMYGLKSAKLQLTEIGLQREDLLNNLRMQVDLAIDNINKQARQINTSEEGVREAMKAHEIMQKSFDIGAATYLDLRDSELADTSARLSFYQAIYNYLVSTSQLDMLLGKETAAASTAPFTRK